MPQEHFTCPFSHLILSGRCGCKFSAKDCVAEKEFGSCLDNETSNLCQSIYYHLRDNSDFALKTHNINNLSVGQQSKIKMGGMLALQEIMGIKNGDIIDDISYLSNQINTAYPNLKDIPFSRLMPRISQFKFRKKP